MALALVCLAVYSNNFRHEYFLDDNHVIQNNLSIRSLDSIPAFFTDAGTFSTQRANVDYRPVLMVTYALNYWMGGLDTTWWHATQILLHFLCAVGLYLLARRILELMGERAEREPYLVLVPLLPALLFAAHPTASGVVNYLSARSSLLTAAFLLPSFLLYMVPGEDPRYRRTPWLAALLFALAMLTKIEAIGALALYFMYDVWEAARAGNHRRNLLGDLRATLTRQTVVRLWPFLAVTLGYFVLRSQVMAPFNLDESRRQPGVSALDYLWTQTVVWWEYVAKWFAPVNLVADNGNHPVYRSPLAWPASLAIAAWVAIGAALVAGWKRRPWLAFLAISALALLSPTSSIAPLSEMLNEHRPYLPLAVLSLAWTIPLGILLARAARTRPAVGAVAVTATLLATTTLGAMTLERNHAFSTNRAYLEDVVSKAPSGRALTNYGLIFMREGNYATAESLFVRAAEYSPNWHIVHINLGIVNRQKGNLAAAQEHFTRAVETDRFSGTALTWRGEHHLAIGDYAAAARDFEAARPKSLDHYALCKGLATANAGLGNVEPALAHTRECLHLNARQTGIDIVGIAKPFFDLPERTEAGLAYFTQLAETIPETWWVHANLATLARRLGDTARADSAQARADALKPAA